MEVSSIELKADVDGIKAFRAHNLGNVVLLAGSNGSGKTRLLKIIEKRIFDWNRNEIGNKDVLISVDEDKTLLTKKSEANQGVLIQSVNYSHFDARLQTPEQFTPYVISQAKKLLINHDYEETALNALLYLTDMAQEYSEEFNKGEVFNEFVKFAKNIFDIDVCKDESDVLIYGRPLASALLSPGQQYLLRMAISCFVHRNNSSNESFIFLFDEPELHLHPKAMLALLENLKSTFFNSQFWISTHSLALIAHWSSQKNTSTLIMNNGKVSPFRSNSSDLLEGLLGLADNRFELSKFIVSPSEYAINKFALECLSSPEVLGARELRYLDGTPLVDNDSALLPDRQAELVNDLSGTILDFGAGQGRFLEELLYYWEYHKIKDPNIDYYAYDIDPKFSKECKIAMQNCKVDVNHYYCGAQEYERLMDSMHGMFDSVVLANVLHEIDPQCWEDTFKNIANGLKDDGKLMILEKSELTDGEAPFENGGFLVLSRNDAEILFDGHIIEKNDKNIVCFVVSKCGLVSVDEDKINACIVSIKKTSKQKIEHIRQENRASKNENDTFKNGIKLAFWTHQFANATMILEPK